MHINAHVHAFEPVDMCAHKNKFIPTKMRPKGGTKIFLKYFDKSFVLILFSTVQWYFNGYLQSRIHISAF